MLGSEFTLFGNLLEADIPKKNINVEDLVTIIKTGTEMAVIDDLRKTESKEDYRQIKKTKTPCVTNSGIFTHRDTKSIVNIAVTCKSTLIRFQNMMNSSKTCGMIFTPRLVLKVRLVKE